MQLPLPYEEPMQCEEPLPSPKPRLVREVLPCATPAQKLIVLPGSDPALPKSKLRRSHPILVPLPPLDGPRSLTKLDTDLVLTPFTSSIHSRTAHIGLCRRPRAPLVHGYSDPEGRGGLHFGRTLAQTRQVRVNP